MIKQLTFILLLGFSNSLLAQNPIVPPGVYIADPSAHQWKDGKMYVYGSRDESPDYYCSHSYDVLSSSDLKTWTISSNAFASKGENDQVSYSDDFCTHPIVSITMGITIYIIVWPTTLKRKVLLPAIPQMVLLPMAPISRLVVSMKSTRLSLSTTTVRLIIFGVNSMPKWPS